jgi:hypothetical protein
LESSEPEDKDFIFRKWADIDFFIVSLVRLRHAATLAAAVPAIRDHVQAALKEFDTQLPQLKTMRDVAEHFEDYALDRGRQKAIRRQQLEVGSLDGKSFEWLDHELDVNLAFEAGEVLFDAIRQAQPAVTAAYVAPCA